MSITVRLWNKEDLEAISKDKWLATVFMNGSSFLENEIKYYPYGQRRTYTCHWVDEEPVTIYATDERMLLKFIDEEYTQRPASIFQVITQYRPVKVS